MYIFFLWWIFVGIPPPILQLAIGWVTLPLSPVSVTQSYALTPTHGDGPCLLERKGRRRS